MQEGIRSFECANHPVTAQTGDQALRGLCPVEGKEVSLPAAAWPCLGGSPVLPALLCFVHTTRSGSFCNQIQEVSDVRVTLAFRIQSEATGALCCVSVWEHNTDCSSLESSAQGARALKENAAQEALRIAGWVPLCQTESLNVGAELTGTHCPGTGASPLVLRSPGHSESLLPVTGSQPAHGRPRLFHGHLSTGSSLGAMRQGPVLRPRCLEVKVDVRRGEVCWRYQLQTYCSAFDPQPSPPKSPKPTPRSPEAARASWRVQVALGTCRDGGSLLGPRCLPRQPLGSFCPQVSASSCLITTPAPSLPLPMGTSMASLSYCVTLGERNFY